MAERVMLGWGEFRFEIDTLAYQAFSLHQSWRWPEQARIQRDSALQFVGRSAAEIELKGVIYPSFKGGLGQIEAMRTLADAGKPQVLVDGLGRIWGSWVLVDIGDTRTLFTDDGQARKLEFTLKLKAYGEDDVAQARLKPWVASASGNLVAQATAQLDALAQAADALPDITEATTMSAVAPAVTATRALVGEVTQTVAGVARAVGQAVSETVGSVRQSVLAAIPAPALQAVRDVQRTVDDLQVLRSDLQSTIASAASLPQTLRRDITRLDGELRLASDRSGAAGRLLRETEQRLQHGVAHAAHVVSSVAGHAEQLSALSDKAQACSRTIVQKWAAWHG